MLEKDSHPCIIAGMAFKTTSSWNGVFLIT